MLGVAVSVIHMQEKINFTAMDNQPSPSGQSSGDNADRTPVYVVDDCDDGREWTSTS